MRTFFFFAYGVGQVINGLLCKKYNIKITPQTVLTHYEFGQAHPKTSSYGKIDIVYLHPFPEIDKKNMGDFIRNKIEWYFNKL